MSQGMPDYETMDPTQLSGPDLARWELWRAVQQAGTMRDLSLRAGLNSAAISQLLLRTEFTPTPATLRALADLDILGLDYMRMMTLFGHVDPLSVSDEIDWMLGPAKRAISRLPKGQQALVAAEVVNAAKRLVDLVEILAPDAQAVPATNGTKKS